jgi:hypothetical protein
MNVENLLGTHIKKINFEENTAVYENAEDERTLFYVNPKYIC